MKHDDFNFDEVYRQYEDYMLLKNFSKYTISCYLTNFRLYFWTGFGIFNLREFIQGLIDFSSEII